MFSCEEELSFRGANRARCRRAFGHTLCIPEGADDDEASILWMAPVGSTGVKPRQKDSPALLVVQPECETVLRQIVIGPKELCRSLNAGARETYEPQYISCRAQENYLNGTQG